MRGRRLEPAVLACVLLAAAANAADPPVISAVTALSARPAPLANGKSGPINRYGLDVLNFPADDPRAHVVCVYPDRFSYRCDFEVAPPSDAQRRRISVDIPDLDKGTKVTVRLVTASGRADAGIEITNGPHVIHEIETLALQQGGITTTGSDGAPAAATQLTRERLSTMPALATSAIGAPQSCSAIYAQWLNATATDPVFTSPFGALDGSVVLASPVGTGTRVTQQSPPQWLVTYPLSATRAQFIAHYEVIYRVGVCADRVAGSD